MKKQRKLKRGSTAWLWRGPRFSDWEQVKVESVHVDEDTGVTTVACMTHDGLVLVDMRWPMLRVQKPTSPDETGFLLKAWMSEMTEQISQGVTRQHGRVLRLEERINNLATLMPAGGELKTLEQKLDAVIALVPTLSLDQTLKRIEVVEAAQQRLDDKLCVQTGRINYLMEEA